MFTFLLQGGDGDSQKQSLYNKKYLKKLYMAVFSVNGNGKKNSIEYKK